MAEKDIPLDRLLDHPDNAHIVTPSDRAKIGNNIRRTGHYPALIVRELDENSTAYPGEPGRFQILDGHQRKAVFLDLVVEEGLTQFALVHVDDWSPLTDDEALIALATLNSWGDNVPRRRAELLHHISEFTAIADMANVLPETARQIEDAKKLLQRPVASIKKLVEQAEQPDVVELAFAVGGGTRKRARPNSRPQSNF